jgi:hypothetical protein
MDCTIKSIHGNSFFAKGKGAHSQRFFSGEYFIRKNGVMFTDMPQIQIMITATTACFGFNARYVLGLTTAIQRSIVKKTHVNMEM